jgi:hypothetical protein
MFDENKVDLTPYVETKAPLTCSQDLVCSQIYLVHILTFNSTLTFILILYSPLSAGLLSHLFPLDFPIKILYEFLIFLV